MVKNKTSFDRLFNTLVEVEITILSIGMYNRHRNRTVAKTDNERTGCSLSGSAVEAKLLITALWDCIDFYYGV